MDFIFFLEFFDFKSDEVYFYINKWKNTFIQSKDYITKIVNNKQNIDFYKYDFEDNKLSFKSIIPQEKTITIKTINNIDNYSIDCLIYDFNKFINPDNEEKNNNIDNDKYKFII